MGRTAFISVAIVLAAIVGFAIGRTNGSSALPISTLNNSAKAPTTNSLEAASNPLFKSQAATFQGKILSLSNNMLQVESEGGQKGEFGLSEKVTIYSFPKNNPVASASSDLKTIETGKLVLINLELVDGKYKVVTISYFRTP